MQAGTYARRVGGQAAPSGTSRGRLGKREWQDVRRAARTLNTEGTLYAVEVHGIKIFFRWAVPHGPPVEANGGAAATQPSEAADTSTASARTSRPQPSRPMNSRQRRSAQRLQEFIRHNETVSHQQGADVQAREAQASCERVRLRGTAAITRGDTDST